MILFGLAWAIGGEKYFGMWKRGLLVLIPIYIHGVIMNLPPMYFICQAMLVYPVYQLLFYDMCIVEVYAPSTPPERRLAGLVGLFINGFIVSLQPIVYLVFTDNMYAITEVVMICGLGFIFITWLSNRVKITLPFWKFKDSWFLSCLIYGVILSLCFRL